MKDSFIVALGSPQPVPGGGAAAAHGALVGLALTEKILRVESSRSEISTEQKSFWSDQLDTVVSLKESLRHLRDEDGKAYLKLVEAKASGGRGDMLDPELHQATDCPVQMMRKVPEALACIARVGEHCRRHLLSDLLVAAELLYAAGQGVCHIASANLRLFADASIRASYRTELEAIQNESLICFTKAKEVVFERINKGLTR